MKHTTLRAALISAFILGFLLGNVSIEGQMVTVNPEEYPGALNNPLKGFRPGLNDAGDPDYPFTAIVGDYIDYNVLENDVSDGVQKIIDYSNKEWAGLEDLNVKVIPRVYLQYGDNDYYYPADLTDGDWTSQEVKDRVVNMIYQMGEAWDNDPRVAWIQTGMIPFLAYNKRLSRRLCQPCRW